MEVSGCSLEHFHFENVCETILPTAFERARKRTSACAAAGANQPFRVNLLSAVHPKCRLRNTPSGSYPVGGGGHPGGERTFWRCRANAFSCKGFFDDMLRMPGQKRKSFFRMLRSDRIKTRPSSHLGRRAFLSVARQGVYLTIALAKRSRASTESSPGRLAQKVRKAVRWAWASGFRSKCSSGCSGSSQSPHGFRPAWMM